MGRAVSLEEFESELDQYRAARRARDRRLGAVLAACVLSSVVAVQSTAWLPRAPLLTVALVAISVLGATAVYVLVTTRAFHRRHAPRCLTCGTPVVSAERQLALARDVASLMQRHPVAPNVRTRLLAEASVRCPRCGAAIAEPRV